MSRGIVHELGPNGCCVVCGEHESYLVEHGEAVNLAAVEGLLTPGE